MPKKKALKLVLNSMMQSSEAISNKFDAKEKEILKNIKSNLRTLKKQLSMDLAKHLRLHL